MTFVERCRKRCTVQPGDDGFTLIELLVVLLIIGILLAVALPTYLSITKGANANATQQDLNTALTGSDVYWTAANQGTYANLATGTSGTSDIAEIDVGLSFSSAAASQGPGYISFNVPASGTALVLVAYAPGENVCWGILDLKASQPALSASFPGAGPVGTYYFAYDPGSATKATCLASTASTTSAYISTAGWPKA